MTLVNCSQIQVATIQFSNNGAYGVSVDAMSADNLFVNGLYTGNGTAAFLDNGSGTLIRSNIGLADN